MVNIVKTTLRRAQQALLLGLTLVLVLPALPAHATTPSIGGAETQEVSTQVNGHLDHVLVKFDTDPGAVTADQFTVAGHTVDTVAKNGNDVTLGISEGAAYDTGEKPTISFTDAEGTVSIDSTDADYVDNAAAVLVAAVGDDVGTAGLFLTAGDKLTLQFSEPVALFNAGTNVPAATPADRHIALEQFTSFSNLPAAGCRGDGDGLLQGSNFPSVAQNGTTDPIEEDFGNASAVEYHPTITVEMRTGNAGSVGTQNRSFSATPEASNPQCKISLTSDVANQKNVHAADGLTPKALPAGTTIMHGKGILSGAPFTGSSGAAAGRIDQVTIKFNHALIESSATTTVLNRFSVMATVNGTETTLSGSQLSLPTGAVNNDKLTIAFAPPTGWDTGVTPSVTYDGSNCAVGGLRIATNNGFFSECVEGFSDQATDDKTAPVLLGAITFDSDAEGLRNGKLNGVDLTFSEVIKKETWTASDFTVAGYAPDAVTTASGNDDRVVRVTFPEAGGTQGDTDAAPAVGYTGASVKDMAGNAVPNTTAGTAVDAAGPVLMAGSVYDVMKGTTTGTPDGRIDEAVLTFSEPIADASVDATKFRIGAVAANVFKATPVNVEDSRTANDRTITVAVNAGIDTTQAVALAADAAAVKDLSANAIDAPASTLPLGSVADHAAPMIMSVSPTGQSTTAVNVAVTFSESMDDQQSLTVSYSGGDLATPVTVPASIEAGHTNGWRDDNDKVWEGVASAPELDTCDAPAGCAYTLSVGNGKALGGAAINQALDPDTRFPWVIDSIAPQAPAVTAPGTNQTLTTSGSTGTVTVSGTAGEAGITVEIREGETLLGTVVTGAGTGFPWSKQLTGVSLGAHTINVIAKDAGGNTSAAVTRAFSVKQATSLAMARSASIVVYGGSLTISGTLKNAAGQGIANVPVTVQGLTYGQSTWRNLATVTTSSTGGYAWTHKPSASVTYRTVYAGTPTVAGATSNAIGVPVRAILTAGPNYSMTLGKTWTAYGSVRPAHGGKYVRVMQWTSSGWKTIANTRLDASSNWRWAVRPGARGTYKYRFLYYKQDLEHFEYWQDRLLYVR